MSRSFGPGPVPGLAWQIPSQALGATLLDLPGRSGPLFGRTISCPRLRRRGSGWHRCADG